jgi:hypothetical protein
MAVNNIGDFHPAEISGDGEPYCLEIGQVIAMLTAGQAQGATSVKIAVHTPDHYGIASGVEWVSMAPVDGCIYIGAVGLPDSWDTAGAAAAESLDWA